MIQKARKKRKFDDFKTEEELLGTLFSKFHCHFKIHFANFLSLVQSIYDADHSKDFLCR